MKKSSLRAFGIAFFMIGAFIAIVNYFQIDIPLASLSKESQSFKEYEEQITTLKIKLEKANEQITQLENQVSSNNEHVTEVETPETDQASTNRESEIVYGTLQIYSGITPYVVGQKLEDLGIVKNALEVELHLARPEYARSIQIGEFELNSSMSIEEIAKIITGKGQDEE